MLGLLGLLVAPLLALGSPLVQRANPSQVIQCLSAAGLAPVVSSSSSYTSSIAAFNQRLQPSPLTVIYPTSEGQVSKAVKCAIGQGVPISARGGGHSYASFGLGGTDGALVVDLANFKSVRRHRRAPGERPLTPCSLRSPSTRTELPRLELGTTSATSPSLSPQRVALYHMECALGSGSVRREPHTAFAGSSQ